MNEALCDDGGRCRFGVFEFDARALELRKNGRAAKVRPQSLKLLAMLVQRPGDVVSREEIQSTLWGSDTFVDFEQGVNHCIRDLRSALSDSAESPRFIQTLPRRGYRFIAPVQSAGEAATSAGAAAPATVQPTTVKPRTVKPRTVWRPLAGLAVALAFLGLALFSYTGWRPGRAVPKTSRLVVMPFSTTSGDPNLGTGLANAVAVRLGGQSSVVVQPMGRGGESPADASSGALVLTGEITTRDANVTLAARLEDPSTGAAVWSDRFSVRADQLFSVEDVVAERVVDALNLRLAAADQERLRRRYTSSTAAYEQYLLGRAALVRYTEAATREAIRAFEAALQRDPGFALARAGLAMASADMYLRFAPAAEIESWGTRAEAEARAALDGDPNLAEAHLARATVARKREFDWNATVEASRRALVLNPSLDHAHYYLAAAYYHLGYMDEALIEMKKGRDLHGVDVIEPARIEALVALFSGNFGTAVVHLEKVSRLSSRPLGDTYLALAYYYSGSSARGQSMLTELARSTSASTASRAAAALAGVLAAQGDGAGARRHLESVIARDYRDHHVAYSLSAAYAQLGEFDSAARWLRTAADTGFPCLSFVDRDPLLEPLRRHAGFATLRGYVQARRDATLPRTDR